MRNLELSILILVSLALPLPAATPGPFPEWVSAELSIPYDKYADTTLDVFQSKKSTRKGPRPAVVNIHGGGWMGKAFGQIFERMCQPYLEKGFVVVSIEYRMSGTAIAPAAVNDTLTAIKWLRDNAKKYNVDTRKIIAAGSSAGGHLSLMAAMVPASAGLGPPAQLAAAVNFCGITDVAELLSGPNEQQYAVAWVPVMPDPKDRLRLAALVSPMTYVRKDLPPILTLHGTRDNAVPYDQSVKLTEALKKAGAPTEMITVPQGPHRFKDAKLVELYPTIFEFLKSHGIE